jgi:hypothetical protein
MRGIVGEERRGKETDGCPLTELSTTTVVTPLNLQLNITKAFRTRDYSKKSLLHRYAQVFKEKKHKQLYFPTHVDNNHWVPMSVDFKACTLCYGEFYEPCQILLPNLTD